MFDSIPTITFSLSKLFLTLKHLLRLHILIFSCILWIEDFSCSFFIFQATILSLSRNHAFSTHLSIYCSFKLGNHFLLNFSFRKIFFGGPSPWISLHAFLEMPEEPIFWAYTLFWVTFILAPRSSNELLFVISSLGPRMCWWCSLRDK